MLALNCVEMASLENFLKSRLEAEFEQTSGNRKGTVALLDDTANRRTAIPDVTKVDTSSGTR